MLKPPACFCFHLTFLEQIFVQSKEGKQKKKEGQKKRGKIIRMAKLAAKEIHSLHFFY